MTIALNPVQHSEFRVFSPYTGQFLAVDPAFVTQQVIALPCADAEVAYFPLSQTQVHDPFQ
jgi:hypothetical protein